MFNSCNDPSAKLTSVLFVHPPYVLNGCQTAFQLRRWCFVSLPWRVFLFFICALSEITLARAKMAEDQIIIWHKAVKKNVSVCNNVANTDLNTKQLNKNNVLVYNCWLIDFFMFFFKNMIYYEQHEITTGLGGREKMGFPSGCMCKTWLIALYCTVVLAYVKRSPDKHSQTVHEQPTKKILISNKISLFTTDGQIGRWTGCLSTPAFKPKVTTKYMSRKIVSCSEEGTLHLSSHSRKKNCEENSPIILLGWRLWLSHMNTWSCLTVN